MCSSVGNRILGGLKNQFAMPILVSQLGVLQVIEHPKRTLSIFGKDHTIYGQRERQGHGVAFDNEPTTSFWVCRTKIYIDCRHSRWLTYARIRMPQRVAVSNKFDKGEFSDE